MLLLEGLLLGFCEAQKGFYGVVVLWSVGLEAKGRPTIRKWTESNDITADIVVAAERGMLETLVRSS